MQGAGQHLLQPGTLALIARTKQEKQSLGSMEEPGWHGRLCMHSDYLGVKLQCHFTINTPDYQAVFGKSEPANVAKHMKNVR